MASHPSSDLADGLVVAVETVVVAEAVAVVEVVEAVPAVLLVRVVAPHFS